jgi:hypothetical protein
MTLTPTTSKLIAKCKKAYKVNLLTRKLAIKELFKRQQAKLNKACLDYVTDLVNRRLVMHQ